MSSGVAPHNLEAERAVLGSLLINDVLIDAVIADERLAAEHFYREQYGHVFQAMCDLHDDTRPVDEVTVGALLTERGLDAPEDLRELAAFAIYSPNVRGYARIVRELAIRRLVLRQAFEIQERASDGKMSLAELIADAEERMLSVVEGSATELKRLAVADEMERLAGVRDGAPVVGVASGFLDLDRLTAGLQTENLIILAARPSMGKSALAVNIAENVAAVGTPVAVFSLEMSRSEILRRLLASQARVTGDELLRGPIAPQKWQRLTEAVERVVKWPLFVDESGDASVLDVRVKARRLHSRTPLGLIVVDYVQLMRSDASAENRNVEVGRITRGLKVLAKELGVPVLAVSQLSRAVEHRHDKRPILSDLRDSGSVEQDADLVVFLYRDDYYDENATEPGVTEVNVAKHRNGAVGKVKLTFLSRYPRFANYVEADRFAGMPVGSVSQDGEEMAF